MKEISVSLEDLWQLVQAGYESLLDRKVRKRLPEREEIYYWVFCLRGGRPRKGVVLMRAHACTRACTPIDHVNPCIHEQHNKSDKHVIRKNVSMYPCTNKKKERKKETIRAHARMHAGEGDAHVMRKEKPSVVPSAWKSKDGKQTLVSKKVKTNAHSLAKEYRALILKVFASPPSPLSGRELAHLAALAKQLGPKASTFLRFAVENWNVVRVKIGAKDILPTVKTIFAFREQIIFLTSSKDMGTTDTTKTDEEEGW